MPKNLVLYFQYYIILIYLFVITGLTFLGLLYNIN